MTLCPTCHQPITEGPKLVCGRCLKPIKRGQKWHHQAGRACHNDCDQVRNEQEKAAPLLDTAAASSENSQNSVQISDPVVAQR